MSTSGIYRSLVDLDAATCDHCGRTGDVLAVADDEDRTVSWECPNCGTEHDIPYADIDRGAISVQATLWAAAFVGVVAIILGLTIPEPPLAGFGAAILFGVVFAALFITTRKDPRP